MPLPSDPNSLSFSQIRNWLNLYAGGYSSTDLSLSSMSTTAYNNNHDDGYNPGGLNGATPHQVSELRGWYAKGSGTVTTTYTGSIEWDGYNITTTGGFSLTSSSASNVWTGLWNVNTATISSSTGGWGNNTPYNLIFDNNQYNVLGTAYSDSSGFMGLFNPVSFSGLPSVVYSENDPVFNNKFSVYAAPAQYSLYLSVDKKTETQSGLTTFQPWWDFTTVSVSASYPGQTGANLSNSGTFSKGVPASISCSSYITTSGTQYY